MSTNRSRRNLLFSVTLTEIVLLVVFLFLLLLAPEVSESEATARRLDKQNEILREENDQLLQVASGLEALLQRGAEKFEDPEEFTRLVRRAAEEYVERSELMQYRENEEDLRTSGTDAQELRMRVQELCEQTVETLSNLREIVVAAEEGLQAENSQLKAQIANYQKRFGRGGLDYPPCWLVERGPDIGQIQYLLNVTIGEDSLSVSEGWPEQRAAEARGIPGVQSLLKQGMQESRFRELAAPVLAWSAERNCRHYVRVFDRAESKSSFKSHLLAVESFFYKWLEIG